MSAAPQPDLDISELRALANNDLESLVTSLKGPPNKALSSRRTWRYGAKGSQKIEMVGRKRGLWISFEGGGGDIFDLIRQERGGSFGEAVRFLAERYGSDPGAVYVTLVRLWSGRSLIPKSRPRTSALSGTPATWRRPQNLYLVASPKLIWLKRAASHGRHHGQTRCATMAQPEV